MNTLELLITSLNLLYCESKIKEKVENSSELVKSVISKTFAVTKNPRKGLYPDQLSPEENNIVNPVLLGLKNLVLDICEIPFDQEIDKLYIKQKLSICLAISPNSELKTNIVKVTDDFFNNEPQENKIKRLITENKKQLNNFYKKSCVTELLDEASRMTKYNEIKDFNEFLASTISKLEIYQINNTMKDPAVLSELDIGNKENLIQEFTSVKKQTSNGKLFKTGWTPFNDMIQGGFREGETIFINALQHKYKTGTTLTLFKQIAQNNKPRRNNPEKMPLLLRISFEDDLSSNLQFLYQNLVFNETGEDVDISNISPEEMSAYVTEKLTVNGFHIKFMRVDPTQWTYKSLFNKIIELEAAGYEVELLMLDYLAHIPTTGCITSGALGTDIRDLVRRIRNFCSSKKITLITPHQLSSEAKNLLRSGMSEHLFVKEINEKGYFSGSKQLDQEMDLEIYAHIFKHGKDTFLCFQRGKHRIPTIIADHLKYFMLKFPKKMPIPDSRPDVVDWYYTLPNLNARSVEDSIFN